MKQARNAFMDAYRNKRHAMGFNEALKLIAYHFVTSSTRHNLHAIDDRFDAWFEDFEQWLCDQSAEAEQRYTASLRTMNELVCEHGDFTTITTREYDDLRNCMQDQVVARNLEAAAHEAGASATKRARNMASAGASFYASMQAARALFQESPPFASGGAARAPSVTK
jgi:hypothetical protein